MTTLVKHAIFLEPEGVLREFILSYKERINSVLPNQPYCHHPPHSTLFMSVLEQNKSWLERLESAIQRIPPFHAKVRDTVIFYNDEFTDGGHTIALCVEPSAELFLLQQTVAETLASCVDGKTLEPPSGFLENEPFRTAYLKYGFPFVGEHWIPHFTIASLQVSGENPLIVEFQNLCPEYDFVVNRLGVWSVEGDNHTQLAVLKLGEQ